MDATAGEGVMGALADEAPDEVAGAVLGLPQD